ncbi:MAG: hypothetical protein ACLP9Y_00320 [Mycobacterium sp.]
MSGDDHPTPREGLPWLPEESFLVLAKEPTPPAAFEFFDAIRQLREAAIKVVSAHGAGGDINAAISELGEALLLGVEPCEPD